MELEKIEASMQNYFALIEQSDFNQAKESSNDLLNALKNLSIDNEESTKNEFITDCLRIIDGSSGAIDLCLICGGILIKSKRNSADFDDWFEKELDKRQEDFGKLCLITGCLNYGNGKFLEMMFPIILNSCQTPSNHSYQSFQALKLWSAKLKSDFLRQNPTRLQNLLDLINANWENPLRGVTDLLTDTLNNVLENVGNANLDREMMDKALKSLSWKTKAKYPLLLVLLPRLGVLETVNYDFGGGLVQSLSSNHLASAGAALYKVILKTKNVLPCWQSSLLPHLLHALCHDPNGLVRTNAKNHWLNPTLNILPMEAAHELLRRLDNSTPCRMATFLILKGLRLNGHLHAFEAGQISDLCNGLTHSDWEVRIAAFGAICHLKKKATHPPAEELQMVHQFVVDNLSMDEASFRQTLVSDFTQLMLRCRDCCIGLHKKGQDSEYLRLMQQISALMESLFDNLFPGANYQRLISVLELLKVMHGAFWAYTQRGMNKSSTVGDPSQVVRHVQDHYGLMHFYTERHLRKMLAACVLHYMIDVKSLASEILAHFRPPEPLIAAVWKKAILCSNSSKFSQCESAGILFELCCHWKCRISVSIDIGNNRPLGKAIEKVQEMKPEKMAYALLYLYREIFHQRQEVSFLELARNAPMHGLLTSLRAILPLEQLGQEFFAQLCEQLEKSVGFMLNILGSNNASFAEMGVAVENMIQENNQEAVTISDEHSLILACAWLNLKECCLLAAKLSLYCSADEVTDRAGLLIISVLTGTRHKGALEAAASALAQICCSLKYGKMPEKWLLTAMEEMKNSYSITRRSAGLPMLVRAIVSSEKRGNSGGRHLLNLAMNGLLQILRQKIDEEDETRDLPQSHALHVLKSLIHDSSLSHDVMPHLAVILQHCVDNFDSPFWAIRNAALQLFGSLMPRLLGQTKLRSPEDEDSLTMYNAVTAQELFNRHHALANFLLQRLRNCQKLDNQPSLVPILCMLSRVSPGLEIHPAQAQFKKLFLFYLGHREMAVRKLAAKSLISFTARPFLMSTLEKVQTLLGRNANLNNFIHGCLLAWTYGIRLMKSEYSQDLEKNRPKLVEGLSQMEAVVSGCLFNRLILQDLKSGLFNGHANIDIGCSEDFHPGGRDFLIKYGKDNECIASLDDCKRYLKNEKGSSWLQFMENNVLKRHLLTGPMVEECNRNLQKSLENGSDSERALEILTIVTHPKLIVEKEYGTTACSSSMVTASMAISVIAAQPDFTMFFGLDGSPYVSLFGDLAEAVVNMAASHHQEVIRLHAAEFIWCLRKVFAVQGQLTIHMRYGLVQILNAALTLLADENGDVRDKIVAFVSHLEGRPISRVKAIEALTRFGLDHLEDCAEYFSPIAQLSNVDWTLIDSDNGSQLFQSGDGINVFEEEAFALKIYFNVLMKWLLCQKKKILFRFLNCGGDILSQAIQYSQTLTNQTDIFGPLIHPKCYSNAIKAFYLMQMVSKYPFLVNLSPEDTPKLEAVATSLQNLLELKVTQPI